MSDERGDAPEQPRVGSSPPPGAGGEPASSPPPGGPVASTPPPGGEEPDRASKGGRFLTRYAGLPEVGWGGGMVALGVLIAAGTMLIGTIMVAIFDPELDSPAARNAAQLAVALSLGGTALGFAFFDAGGRIKESFGKLGLGPRIALGAIGLAVLAWFVYILCAGILTPLLQPDQEDVTRELGTNKDELGSVAVAAFLIVIAAPLSEEMFFRGFMFAGLRRAMSIWPAALISAAVWGSLHLGAGNIGVAIQLAVFGVILAWLYERSGTLWAPVLAHAINNTIAFVLLVTDVV
ncbi:MAG: CPBP family intramembrane glutamic endopeptidase [Solirubrobacterales bacterium]